MEHEDAAGEGSTLAGSDGAEASDSTREGEESDPVADKAPWEPVAMDDAVRSLITSISGQSLVFFCGAGLSMDPPSALPSAGTLVDDLEEEYQTRHGTSLTGQVGNDIEEVAAWALGNAPEFQNFFLPTINSDDFFQPPNPGHETVADFLIARIAEAAISTNVDYLIETAGRNLGRARFKGIVRCSQMGNHATHAPLLKLHGCFDDEPQHTVWCEQQLKTCPIEQRIQTFRNWMQSNLPGKDLLIIGYWTDWPYLNETLQESVRDLQPRSVTLVDPSKPSDLKDKARELATWVTASPDIVFRHVKSTGTPFMIKLRKEFTKSFFRRLIRTATQKSAPLNYYGITASSSPTLPDVDRMDMRNLYNLRRDFQGVPNTRPVTDLAPSGAFYERMGAVHQILMERSASMDGRIYKLNGDALRLVNSRGRLVDDVSREFTEAGDTPRAVTAHVCVGSRSSLPGKKNIVRDPEDDDVVRAGQSQTWWTDDDFLEYLNNQTGTSTP